MDPLLVHIVRLRTRSHVRLTGYPNMRQMVETDSRARPDFELGVDSPGATRICALLVRGTLTFRSFRRLPTKWKPGIHAKPIMGSWYTRARLNLFEKPCLRLWTTQILRLVHRITST